MKQYTPYVCSMPVNAPQQVSGCGCRVLVGEVSGHVTDAALPKVGLRAYKCITKICV